MQEFWGKKRRGNTGINFQQLFVINMFEEHLQFDICGLLALLELSSF